MASNIYCLEQIKTFIVCCYCSTFCLFVNVFFLLQIDCCPEHEVGAGCEQTQGNSGEGSLRHSPAPPQALQTQPHLPVRVHVPALGVCQLHSTYTQILQSKYHGLCAGQKHHCFARLPLLCHRGWGGPQQRRSSCEHRSLIMHPRPLELNELYHLRSLLFQAITLQMTSLISLTNLCYVGRCGHGKQPTRKSGDEATGW